MPRETFGCKGEEVTGEQCMVRSFGGGGGNGPIGAGGDGQ